MSQATITDLSGVWYCQHWYPSKDDTGEDTTTNRMTAHRKGRDLVLESEPNAEGSYMLIRLSIDDNLATGTWHETASPHGDFDGTMYSGAGQLVMSDDNQRMEGQWAGHGYDHTLKKQRIYTGRWELSRTEPGN
ncbi:MAG TPA: hypothetical protein VMY99_02995 [Nevskiaceae bacterium]|nr:hypothetical protein [Nevskiaceae bacterium]